MTPINPSIPAQSTTVTELLLKILSNQAIAYNLLQEVLGDLQNSQADQTAKLDDIQNSLTEQSAKLDRIIGILVPTATVATLEITKNP